MLDLQVLCWNVILNNDIKGSGGVRGMWLGVPVKLSTGDHAGIPDYMH